MIIVTVTAVTTILLVPSANHLHIPSFLPTEGRTLPPLDPTSTTSISDGCVRGGDLGPWCCLSCPRSRRRRRGEREEGEAERPPGLRDDSRLRPLLLRGSSARASPSFIPPFLFPASGKDSPQLAAQLELTNSMGLLLPKTNIPRDFREDVDQRQYFWPREIYSGSQYGGGFARMEEVDGGVLIEANEKTKNNNIGDADTARHYLEESHWIAKDAPFTRADLFAVLLKISLLPQTLQKSMSNTLRALAFMAEFIDASVVQEVADCCAESVATAVSPYIEGLVNSQEGIQTTVNELLGASSTLTAMVEESREELQALEAQVKDLKEAVEKTGKETVVAVEAQASRPVPMGPRSYAAAAATTMTAEQAGILARGVRMRRQILVDKATNAATDSLGGLSELELKEKANLALGIMTEKMEGALFVAARRLQNGVVVFDCLDEKTASWVKSPSVMEKFVAALGGSCVYRPRRLEMVAEMVPIETRIEDGGTWRLVEKESGLKEGDIVGARWIKALHHRAFGQKVAHLKIEFASADAANHAIDGDIFIQGVRVRVRKLEEEARRCAKWQKYDGHLANACKSDVDVCGRCAKAHRTTDCPVTDTGVFGCSNCGVDGHGAVDRQCPVFQREQQRRKAKDPTAGYRYFPTEDPRTWASSATPQPAMSEPAVTQQRGGGGVGTGRLAGRSL
ncbi:hypothetical protein B0H11DRAFT_2219650 [Mycena galericulata]|nr:hypothetical protein B0H11DRAFT_2219650 [Mycena galericulata]